MSENPLIPHQTIQESVAEYIRDKIMSRDYKPGERLMQDELAEQLGVSRTPIREAFHKLASEGFIVLSPHRGASVANFSADELVGIYSIRIALEGYAAYLAAERITDEELEELATHLQKMDKAKEKADRTHLIKLNRQFHAAIYEAAKEERLFSLIENYLDLAERYRRMFHSLENRAEHTVDEHQQLLEALRAHDNRAARTLTHVHLEQTRAALLEAFEKREGERAHDDDG